MRGIIWSTGVTTILGRKDTTLPRTMASLRAAGFDRPHLFIDNEKNAGGYMSAYPGLRVTCHWPPLGAFGNWIVALWIMYIDAPRADRYAIFQDDVIASGNMRAYLESLPMHDGHYWNLYTTYDNVRLNAEGKIGFYESNQFGRGACGLVLSLKAVTDVLSNYDHIVERPQNVMRGRRGIDAAVASALKAKGWVEMVHHPSLLQHIGEQSVIGHDIVDFKHSPTFNGEDFDCSQLVPNTSTTVWDRATVERALALAKSNLERCVSEAGRLALRRSIAWCEMTLAKL